MFLKNPLSQNYIKFVHLLVNLERKTVLHLKENN